jgi:hypothetical protein
MKKSNAKTEIKMPKLRVDREVLRALQAQQLADIVGGTLTSRPTGVSGPPRFCCA